MHASVPVPFFGWKALRSVSWLGWTTLTVTGMLATKGMRYFIGLVSGEGCLFW